MDKDKTIEQKKRVVITEGLEWKTQKKVCSRINFPGVRCNSS